MRAAPDESVLDAFRRRFKTDPKSAPVVLVELVASLDEAVVDLLLLLFAADVVNETPFDADVVMVDDDVFVDDSLLVSFDRSLLSNCFLNSSSSVQKPPLPGSSFCRAIFLKHLFNDKLCLIEFLNVTCQFGSAFLF